MNNQFYFFWIFSIFFFTFVFGQENLEQKLLSKKPSLRFQARIELRQLDSETKKKISIQLIPILIQALQQEDIEIRKTAIWSLGVFGQQAKEASSPLIKILLETDPNTYDLCIWTLTQMNQTTIPALVQLLKGENKTHQMVIITALEKMGPEAKEALPELLESFQKVVDKGYREIKRKKAISRAIVAIGLEATPTLIKSLKKEGQKALYHQHLSGILIQIGPKAVPELIEALKYENKDFRCRIAYTLAKMKSRPKKAIPALLTLLKEDKTPEVQKAVTTALDRISPTVLRVLTAMEELESKDWRISENAMESLLKLGPQAEKAFPFVLEKLKSRRPNISNKGALVLAKIASVHRKKIQILLEKLKDPNVNIRRCVALALGEIAAPKAKEAIPALIEALKDKQYNVRSAAQSAIGKIGAIEREIIPHLVLRLQDPNSAFRSNVAAAISKMGLAAKDTVPDFIEAIRINEREGEGVAKALAELASKVREIIPELIEALKDKDPSIRLNITYALGQIKPSAKKAVPALIPMLKDEIPFIRMIAASSLGNMHSDAKKAIPALIEMLKKEKRFVGIVAEALGNMGEDAKEAIPTLLETLYYKDLEAGVNSLIALKKIAPHSKEVITKFIHRFNQPREKYPYLDGYLIEILAQMDPKVVVPILTKLLEEKDKVKRKRALEILGKMGPKAKLAIPILIQTLMDENPEIQNEAKLALSKVSPNLL